MKRNRIITSILVVCLSLLLAFSLTACGDKCEHTYDNACDVTCNECGEERTVVEHDYTATVYDDHYHYQKCGVCGELNEENKVKHVLNDEYTCVCGVEYTVEMFSEVVEGYNHTTISLYNSNENLVKEIVYINEELYNTIDCYYENDNCVKEEHYLADGTLDHYVLSEYDENGNETKEEIYSADGTLDIYWLAEYDDNGNQTKKEKYLGDGTLSTYSLFEYYENGKLKKSTIDSAGGRRYVKEYNENGNLIRETETDPDGTETMIEYDEYGNPIE